MFTVVDRSADIRLIDRGIKNRFSWKWLEDKDFNGDLIKYANSGKKDLKQHSKSKKHKQVRNERRTTSALPAMFSATRSIVDCANDVPTPGPSSGRPMPYGAPPNVVPADEMPAPAPRPASMVGVIDRKAHLEALLTSFLVEKNLPFAVAPDIVALCKEMNRDPKALDMLSMSRTTASYKVVEGHRFVNHKRLIHDMKESKFSVNLDECFSNNNEKVMSVLVSYFSETMQEVVVKHWASEAMTVVNAEKVLNVVLELFRKDDIPLAQIISNLSDSTNYMRGKINGYETKLREHALQLLDIDGDICHHVRNSVQKFCVQFGRLLEQLADEVLKIVS
jgi:hypothetical protein